MARRKALPPSPEDPMEPLFQPGPTGEDHSVPGLWRTARAALSGFLGVFGEPAGIALVPLFSAVDRRLIRPWLRTLETMAARLTLLGALSHPALAAFRAALAARAEGPSAGQASAVASVEAVLEQVPDTPATPSLAAAAAALDLRPEDPADPASWKLRYPVAHIRGIREPEQDHAPPQVPMTGPADLGVSQSGSCALPEGVLPPMNLFGAACPGAGFSLRTARRLAAAARVLCDPEPFLIRLARRIALAGLAGGAAISLPAAPETGADRRPPPYAHAIPAIDAHIEDLELVCAQAHPGHPLVRRAFYADSS